MKTARIYPLVRLTGLAIALVFLAGFASVANAQGKGAGARTLLELSNRARPKPAPVPSDQVAMSCPKCKDVWVVKADTDGKAAGAKALVSGVPPTKKVASHLCRGCGSNWETVGHGKARHMVASHECTSCGAANIACCNTKKGSEVATNGMEKKFEVAPLK